MGPINLWWFSWLLFRWGLRIKWDYCRQLDQFLRSISLGWSLWLEKKGWIGSGWLQKELKFGFTRNWNWSQLWFGSSGPKLAFYVKSMFCMKATKIDEIFNRRCETYYRTSNGQWRFWQILCPFRKHELYPLGQEGGSNLVWVSG